MDNREFIKNASKHIASSEYTYNNPDVASEITPVWISKILQNNKGLFVRCVGEKQIPDGNYYEVTYNGDKDEYYVDVYVKKDNIKIK